MKNISALNARNSKNKHPDTKLLLLLKRKLIESKLVIEKNCILFEKYVSCLPRMHRVSLLVRREYSGLFYPKQLLVRLADMFIGSNKQDTEHLASPELQL